MTLIDWIRYRLARKSFREPWRRAPNRICLEVIESYDDEGGTEVLHGKRAFEVSIQDLLDHPTAICFLTQNSFVASMPIIFAAIDWGERHGKSITAECLKDHFVAQIKNSWKYLENNLIGDQKEFVDRFVESYDEICS